MVTTVQRKPRPPQEPPSSLSKWHDPKKMRQRGGIFKPSAENPLIDLLLAIPKRPAAGPGSNRRTPRSKTPRRRVVGSGDRGGHEATTANYQPPSSPLLNKSAKGQAKGKARKSKASLSSRRQSTKKAEELDLAEAAANDEDVFETGGGDVGAQTARGKARKSKASLLRRRSTKRAGEMDLAEAAANDEDVFETGGGDVGVQSDAETDNEPLMMSTRRTPGRKQAQPRSDENQPVAPTNAVRRRSSKKFKELAPETSDPPIAVVDLQSSVRSRKHRQLSPIAESSLASPAPPPLKTKLSTAASRPQGKADPITKTKALGKRKTQDEDDFELGSPAKRPRTDTGATRQTPSRAAKHLQFFEQEDSPPAPAPPPTTSVKAKASTTAQKSKASSSKSAATGKKSQALAVAEQVDADAEDLPSVKVKPSTKKAVKAKDIALEAGRDEEHVHEAENIPPETQSAAAPTETASKRTTTDGKGALDNSIHLSAASGSNAKQPSAKALGKRKAEEAILPEDEREVEAPKPKGKKSASKQPKRPKNPAPATKRKPRGQKAMTTRKKRKVEPETDEEDEKDFVDVVVKTKTGDDESSEDEKKGGKGKKTGGSKSKGKVKQASAKRKLPPPRPSMFVKAEAAYLDSEADPMDLLG